LLTRLAEIYETLERASSKTSALEKFRGLYHGSALLFVGHTLHEASLEAGKEDGARETAYRERNRPFLAKRLLKRLSDVHPPHEAALILDAMVTAKALAETPDVAFEAAVEALGGAESGTTIKELIETSSARFTGTLISSVLEGNVAAPAEDSFVRCAAALYPAFGMARDQEKALLSERNQLLAALLEVQRAHSKEAFYPDANGCLRLSAGHVEGYEAADAVQHLPLTTIGGLVDKHVEAQLARGGVETSISEEDVFACPARLTELCRASPAVRTTPVNCLYSTDTVGGNSGSPVLNADGEFVAINFDRQRLGLMNEFKWSREYSRSIGVDVRFILWLVGTYDDAGCLVEEMTAPTPPKE